MSNPFYNNSGVPSTSAFGYSAAIRGEFANIAAGFALLPGVLTANKAVVMNSGGTGMTVSTGSLTLNGDLTVATGKSLTTNSTIILGGTDGSTLSLGGNLTTAAGKTVTISNTLTFTGDDGSSVNFGAGGTVLYSGGSFVNSIAGTANEITASAATGAVTLSLPAALTFTGKTITGGTFTTPALTNPTVTTQAVTDNSTKAASTAFVQSLMALGAGQWIAAGGTADVITATYTNTVLSLTDGLTLSFRATAANATTTPTLNVNGLGAKTITKNGGQALAAGDIAGNLAEVIVVYNLANTRWELLNPAVSSGFTTGTFTVTDNSGASLSFTGGNSFIYRKTSTHYHYWGEFTYPSTANGAACGLAGFPFTSKASSFATNGWLIPAYFTNGGAAGTFAGLAFSWFYLTQNATVGVFRNQGGTSGINSDLTTVRIQMNGVIPL